MDLEKFAKKMFELSDWPEGGDIDGFDFQEAAVECGLLTPETRYECCSMHGTCFCTEYHGDMSGGVTCYRKAQFLLAPNVELTGAARHERKTKP